MKKIRYSDEQIVRILREANQGQIAEVAKRHGISEASIYARRKRFSGMNVDDVKHLRSRVPCHALNCDFLAVGVTMLDISTVKMP